MRSPLEGINRLLNVAAKIYYKTRLFGHSSVSNFSSRLASPRAESLDDVREKFELARRDCNCSTLNSSFALTLLLAELARMQSELNSVNRYFRATLDQQISSISLPCFGLVTSKLNRRKLCLQGDSSSLANR